MSPRKVGEHRQTQLNQSYFATRLIRAPDLTSEHEVLTAKSGKQAVRLRFLTLEQVRSPRLREILRATLE